MLSCALGFYYGFFLGFLGAIAWRHWASLYDRPRAYIHEEPEPLKHWSRNGP